MSKKKIRQLNIQFKSTIQKETITVVANINYVDKEPY